MPGGELFDPEDYQFVSVAQVDDLPVNERMFLQISDLPIVLLNLAGKVFAIGDRCTHDDGPLGDGDLDGHQIICPRHGARFDVRTGQVLSLPAVEDTPVYPVRISEGKIEIGILKSE